MEQKNALSDLIKLIRPKQWVKNAFVWVPIFFTPQAMTFDNICAALWSFLVFCCAASAVYIFNDWQDRAADREHPVKCNRPIASRRVSGKAAIALAVVLLAMMLGGFWFVHSFIFTECVIAYLTLNIAYCLWLRHLSLYDIAAISASFLLRLAAGVVLIHAQPSPWIIIMTGLLSLFLAVGKRRDDIIRGYDAAHRQSLHGYNLIYLDSLLQILCAVLLAAYFIFTTDGSLSGKYPHNELLLTTPFVMLGLMRYLQIAKVEKDSGSPTDLLWRDRFLQSCVVGWLLVFGWLLYGV